MVIFTKKYLNSKNLSQKIQKESMNYEIAGGPRS